jgi:hypothetical protein
VELSLGEKINASHYPFETHAVPLHIVAALALAYPIGAYFTWFFLTHPAIVQQHGFTILAAATYVVFAVFLFWGVADILFTKITIDEEKITLILPFVRIFRYRFFPYSFCFDEIRIKRVWGGRILVIVGSEHIDLLKKTVWSTIYLGGIWIMPIRWKRSLKIIDNLQNVNAAVE